MRKGLLLLVLFAGLILPAQSISIGVADAFRGHWFDSKTGSWVVSFLDESAIYAKQVWKYEAINMDKTGGTIILTSNTGKIKINISTAGKGTIIADLGGDRKKLTDDAAASARLVAKSNIDLFSVPALRDDSATYTGIIIDYNPTRDAKTASFAVTNIIGGVQDSYILKIAEDGSFNVKARLLHPQEIIIRGVNRSWQIYLEPGKDLFQLVDRNEKYGFLLFMGESAALNSGWMQLSEIYNLDNADLRNKVLEMTPDTFKKYLLEARQKDYDQVESIAADYPVCPAAIRLKKLNIDYSYAAQMMNYTNSFEGAYRAKNRISATQRTIPVKVEEPTAEYYDFLTNDFVNNPLAIVTGRYDIFINRLKFLRLLNRSNRSVSVPELVPEMVKGGYEFSGAEKEMVDAIMSIPEEEKEVTEFRRLQKDRIDAFNFKYAKLLEEYMKQTGSVTGDFPEIEKYLIGRGIVFTPDEQELADEYKKRAGSPSFRKVAEVYERHSDVMKNFMSRHQEFAIRYLSLQRHSEMETAMKTNLGVEKGFAADVMNSQDEYRYIVTQGIPLTETGLNLMRERISDPFIRAFLESCNKRTLSRLSADSSKTNFTVNKTPDANAEKLFGAILSKYMGKVVYIDFWATWCGPCLSGIREIKPLKDEFDGKDVVFVYITNQTSPKGIYEEMIREIKGEHYRLSEDEWNYLSSEYNITAIPHTMLADKTGKVIYLHLVNMGNDELRKQINYLLDK